jgi:FSR family fosmidomycin resistance protein-like MFS transporter
MTSSNTEPVSAVVDESLAPPATAPDRPLTRLSVMSWAHFLNDGVSNYLPGILPALLVELRLPVAMAGTIMAALLIGQALQPVYGWFADRIGGRGFVLLGVGGTAVGGALIGLAPNAWVLVGLLGWIGLTNSMFHPQALAAVRRLGAEREGLFMSAFLVGGEFGRGIWPVVGSLVAVKFGLHALWVLAVPALVTLPLIHYWAPVQPRRPRHLPAVDWRRHLPGLSKLVAYSSLRAVLIFSLVTFVPLVWHGRGGSLVSGASLIATLLVAGIVGNVGGGHLADRIGRHRVLLGASALFTLALAVFLVTTGAALWFTLALLGVAVFATLPVTILIGQDLLPEDRSLGSGLALGLSNGIGAVVLILLGALADQWGTVNVLWLNVGLGVIATALAVVLPTGESQQSPR